MFDMMEDAKFREGLAKIDHDAPKATARFLSGQLAPDFEAYGLKKGKYTLADLDFSSAVPALLKGRSVLLAAGMEFAASNVKDDDAAAERARLLFRAHGYEGTAWTDDDNEGRILLAFLDAVNKKGDDGWRMLELTRDHLAGKKEVIEGAAKAQRDLAAEVKDVTVGKETFKVGDRVVIDADAHASGIQAFESGAAYEVVSIAPNRLVATLRAIDGQEQVVPVENLARVPAEPAKVPAAIAAPALKEALVPADQKAAIAAAEKAVADARLALERASESEKGATRARLATAESALAAVKDAKKIDALVAPGVDLDANQAANEALVAMLKFLQDMFSGLKDNAFLKGQIDRIETRLADQEWGKALPDGFEKRAKEDKAFAASEEYLYAKKQAEKLAKHEKDLADYGNSLKNAGTLADLAKLNDGKAQAKAAGIARDANVKKFQELYEKRQAQLNVARQAPGKAADAPAATLESMTSEAKAAKCVEAFATLGNEADLADSDGNVGGVPVCEFDADAEDSVATFLGRSVRFDIESKEGKKGMLLTLTRVKNGQEDGVALNGSYLPMAKFQEGLAALFATKPFHFDFQDGTKADADIVSDADRASAGGADFSREAHAGHEPLAPLGFTYEVGKDGVVWLVRADGTKTRERFEHPEVLEKIRSMEAARECGERFALYASLYEVWREKAALAKDHMWKWMGARAGGPAEIDAALRSADEGFQSVYGLLRAHPEKVSAEMIDGLFWPMVDLEDKFTTRIFGKDELAQVRKVVKDGQGTFADRQEKMYALIHGYTLNGGYGSALRDSLGRDVVSQDSRFADVARMLGSPEAQEQFAKAAAKGKASLVRLGVDPKTAEDLVGKYKEISESQSSKAVRAARTERMEKWLATQDLAAVCRNLGLDATLSNDRSALAEEVAVRQEKATVDQSFLAYSRNAIVQGKIDKDPSLAGSGLAKIFRDTGSDATIDAWNVIGQEFAFQAMVLAASGGAAGLVLRGVAAGAGTLAATGVWGLRSAQSISGIALSAEAAGSVAETGVRGWALASAIKGVTFYEMNTFLTNAVHQDSWSKAFEGAGDAKEMGKSVLLFGILGAVGKLAEASQGLRFAKYGDLKGPEKLQKLFDGVTNAVPKEWLTTRAVTGLLAEAGLLTAASQGVEFVVEGEAHLSLQEYVQALMMVAALRGASRVKVSRQGALLRFSVEPSGPAPTASADRSSAAAKFRAQLDGIRSQISDLEAQKSAASGKKASALEKKLARLQADMVRLEGAIATLAQGAPAPSAPNAPAAAQEPASPAVSAWGQEGMREYLSQKDRVAQGRANDARYERAAARTARMAAEADAGRRAELAGRRAYAEPSEAAPAPVAQPVPPSVARAPEVSAAPSAPRAEITARDRLSDAVDAGRKLTLEGVTVEAVQGRGAVRYRVSAAGEAQTRLFDRPQDAKAQVARILSSRAATEAVVTEPTLPAPRSPESFRGQEPHVALGSVQPGESIRFGTLARGAGDFVTVRRIDGVTAQVVEVRGGVEQAPRLVENLRFEAESDGKIFTRLAGEEVTATGQVPYEYANVREIF